MKAIINVLIWSIGINFIIDSPYKSIINISLTLFLAYIILLLFVSKELKISKVVGIEFILLTIFVVYTCTVGGLIAIDTTVYIGKLQTMIQVWILTLGILIMIKLNRTEKKNIYLLFIMPFLMCIYLLFNGDLQNINESSSLNIGGMNPNIFGYMLVIGLIAISYMLKDKSKFKYFFIFLGLPLFIYTILQTGSRNAYIGMLIAFILWFLMCYIPERINKKNLITALIPILIVGVVLFQAYNFMSESVLEETAVGDRLEALGDTSSGSSVSVRLFLYKESLELFKDNFLFGVGLDQFRAYSITGMYTHSDYMEVLVNSGLIGTILYFSIYATLFSKLFKIIYRYKGFDNRIVYTSRVFQVAILVMLYYGFGRPWYDQIGRWFLLATIMGFVMLYKNKLPEKK